MFNNDNQVFKFDYVLLFHEDDMDAVEAYHTELSTAGYNGRLYDDPTGAPDTCVYEMEKIEYFLHNSRVCLVYMSESLCNVLEKKLKHVLYTALDKCLSEKSYQKKLKPYYPETKNVLEQKGHRLDSLGAISGLERQKSFYKQHLQQTFSSSGLSMDEQDAIDLDICDNWPIQARDVSTESFEPQRVDPVLENEHEERPPGEETSSQLPKRWIVGTLVLLSGVIIAGFRLLKSS